MKFLPENYGWSVEGLKKCIYDNYLQSEIIAENNHAAIVHVKSYNDSILLGAFTNWCISQHSCSWEQYVSKNGNYQVFIYDFTKKPEHEISMVGATYTKEGKLICSFTRVNIPLFETTKCSTDSFAIYNKILKPLFGKTFLIDKLITKDVTKNKVDEHIIPKIEKPTNLDNSNIYSYKPTTSIWNYPFYDEYEQIDWDDVYYND